MSQNRRLPFSQHEFFTSPSLRLEIRPNSQRTDHLPDPESRAEHPVPNGNDDAGRNSPATFGLRAIVALSLLSFALGSCLKADAQFKREDFQSANEATVRLKPSDFSLLPADIRNTLEQRGCTIPQPYNAQGRKENVISGHFTSSDQTDWAILCSREKRSAVLVFHGGRSEPVDAIDEEPDLQYLQVVSSGREIAYSRRIAVLTARAIRVRKTQASQSLRSLDHDGIDDVFLGKGSVLWYYSNSKWVKLPGAD